LLGKTKKYFLTFALCILGLAISSPLSHVSAFGEKEVALINMGIPAIQAGIRAHRRGRNIGKAVLQALFGGYIMQQGFVLAPNNEKAPAWKAWRSKIMVNLGASLAESAGEEFKFRMDIGPIWFLADKEGFEFKPGINSSIAPIIHLFEGSKIDWGSSFKYGTMAFKRPSNYDGTINSSGALAYSNANTFTTNMSGAHAGHELVHTFQYRRESFMSPSVSQLFPEIGEQIGDGWIDDTGWSINWGLQCSWADMSGKSKDFDIPMEKEAYYLEERYGKNY
jgi:hypothetical protein